MRIDFLIKNSPRSLLSRTVDPLYAGSCLARGELVIYPTETFYALGCKSGDNESIENIIKIKKRPPDKALPLIAADLQQAAAYCDLSKAPVKLLDSFWPGPLTLVLPAARPLHPALVGADGKIAIRLSSSPFARSLARQCGEAIISSSANISGQPPVRLAQDLDPELLKNISSSLFRACILKADPINSAKKASTIVEAVYIARKCHLRILRSGVITETMLMEKGFSLIS